MRDRKEAVKEAIERLSVAASSLAEVEMELRRVGGFTTLVLKICQARNRVEETMDYLPFEEKRG